MKTNSEAEYILPDLHPDKDIENDRGPIHSQWVNAQNQNQTSFPVRQLELPSFKTEEEDPDIEIKEEVGELFMGRDEEMMTMTNDVNNSNPSTTFKSVAEKICKRVIFQRKPKRSPRRRGRPRNTKIKTFPCARCGLKFPTSGLKQIHEKGCGRAPNSQIPCAQCDKMFLTKHHLIVHTRKAHNADSTWKCRYCELGFSSCESRFNHEEDTHKTIPCTQDGCDSKFYSEPHLNEHIWTSHTDKAKKVGILKREALGKKRMRKRKKSHSMKPRSCKVCGRKFSSATTRDRHEWTHTDERPFPCNKEGCEEKFLLKKSLETHLRRVHGEGEISEIVRPHISHTCEECPKNFQTKLQLVIHKRRHTGERPFKCEKVKSECSATFHSASDLKSHIKRCHNFGGKLLRCNKPDCNQKYSTKSALQKHFRKEHAVRRKIMRPYSCEKSDNTTQHESQTIIFVKTQTGGKVKYSKLNTTEKLETHTGEKSETHTGEKSETHTEEKSHRCEHCEISYKSSHGLKIHMLSHHPQPGDKKYKCEHCGNTFSLENSYKRHMATTHATQKKKCEYCEKDFTSASGLELHVLRQHAKPEEMTYKCEHENCDKIFAKEMLLKMHSKIHSKEKRFKCQKCDGAFKDNSQLTNHIIFKHRYDEDVQKQYWTE